METDGAVFIANPDLRYLGTETAFNFGAEVAKVEKSGKFNKIYKFHIGDTGPRTPLPIIETAIQALRDKQTKYAPYLGFPQARENIARYLTRERGVEIKAENIMLEPGGKPAIELAMQALLGPDDYVVGQNPGYPIYESLAKFYTQGKYIPWLAKFNREKNKLEFDARDLEEILKTNRRVKLLVVNTPQNPTGLVLSREILEKIAALAKRRHFMVLFDDIYDKIVFGSRQHVSLLSIPGMLDYTINLNGYSKVFAMSGWRLGYLVAPAWLIEIFGKLAINKWSCVSRVNQIVAGAIFGEMEVDGCQYAGLLEKLKPLIANHVAEYEKKGNFLVEVLKLLEPYVIPNETEGAFYEFPNIQGALALPYVKNDLGIKNDVDFVKWLLFEKGFAALAGSDFGEGGRGFLRLSYSEDQNEQIIPGAKYFAKIIAELAEKSAAPLSLSKEEMEARIDSLEKKYFDSRV
ncbi:MAG: aminotransferase class I/II-fold pyridoxal phosphate-dependent enzyme [Candidatus Magasanikbacteria bacterium]|nr:aminotransferase class I/II-fold pyridoxal phosphate-dependent enzyme [Candidatus Magasanikbacteria bacterium]